MANEDRKPVAGDGGKANPGGKPAKPDSNSSTAGSNTGTGTNAGTGTDAGTGTNTGTNKEKKPVEVAILTPPTKEEAGQAAKPTAKRKRPAKKKNETNAEILLIAPPPCISSEVVIRYKFPDEYKNTDLNIKLKEYVDRMGNTATENKIPFINLFTLFSGKKRIGLTQDSLIRNKLNSGIEDGAHPTEEGYLLIGKTVYNNLITEGFDCTRLVCFGDSLTFGYPYGGMGTLEGNNFPAAVSRLLNGETE